jgi:hypothetical protein
MSDEIVHIAHECATVHDTFSKDNGHRFVLSIDRVFTGIHCDKCCDTYTKICAFD